MAALQGGETSKAGKWIRTKLVAAGITNAHPAVAPYGTALPYVVWQHFPRPDGEDVQTLQGGRAMVKLRYLVKALAVKQSEAEPLARQIDAGLDGEEGPIDDYYVSSCSRVMPFELPTTEGQETYWQVGGYYDINLVGIFP
jgi:hypothetical protein